MVDYHRITPKDCMIIISNSGNNIAPVDAALRAKEKGIPVIGITACAYSDYLKTKHKDGVKLKDIADAVSYTHLMGNLSFGLTVGATLQLMVLGVSNFGGSSLPDFMSAALIGTALGTISGKGVEFGIGLAVPVGMLLVQLDVFARFANTFFQHRADRYMAVSYTHLDVYKRQMYLRAVKKAIWYRRLLSVPIS